MKKQPDEEILDNLDYRQLTQSEQQKPVVFVRARYCSKR